MANDQGNEGLTPEELRDKLKKEESSPHFELESELFRKIEDHLKSQNKDEVLQTQQAAEQLIAKFNDVLGSNPEYIKRLSEVSEEAISDGVVFNNGEFVYQYWGQVLSDFEQQAIIRRKKVGSGSGDTAAQLRERPVVDLSFWDEEIVITSYNGPGERGIVSGPSIYFRKDQEGKLFPGSDKLTLQMDEEMGMVSKYGNPTDTEFVEWGALSFLVDLNPLTA